jgi:folate-binding protein YgfZ
MNAVDQIAAEYASLTEAAGFVRREQPGLLALRGDDAAEFLNGQLTNDIEAIAPREGRYAALLTPKGKMRADMRVIRTPQALFVITDRGLLPTVRKMIDTFRIGFTFELEDSSESCSLVSLIGPDADSLIAAFSGDGEALGAAENSNLTLNVDGAAFIAIRTLTGIDFIGAAAATGQAVEALAEKGVPEVSDVSAEIIRIERGIPSYGHELDETTIPGEAGLNERAVSFEKGCYVGQETVARMHYKGKPNRVLRGLKADEPLTAGAMILAGDGRELGRLGTAVESPANGSLGLSVLRKEASPGDKVDVGGVSATVMDISSFPA